jgi:hypothetical protein
MIQAPLRHGFLGSARINVLGQITDPKILARVDLAEAFGNSLKAVSQVVQVAPETMAASVGTANETFKAFIKNPSFIPYAVKLLVLSAIMVENDIRALGFQPEQLSNILQGADQAIRSVVSEEELSGRIKASEDEILGRAPENIKAEVKNLVATTGITKENLAPNLPVVEQKDPSVSMAKPEMSTLEKVALVGIPLIILVAVGMAWKR